MLGSLASAIAFAGALATDPSLLPAPAPVDVEVFGNGCPSSDDFRAEAERRLPSRRDPSRTLTVKLGPSKRGFTGTVAVKDVRDGSTVASRTVEGTSCVDVASAALLVVALGALDVPEATKESEPREAVPLERASLSSDTGAPARATTPSRDRLRFNIAAVGAFTGGYGPIASGIGARIGGAIGGYGIFRPEVRVGIDAYMDALIDTGVATATRSLVAGRVDLCPFGIGAQPLDVRVCASGALGEVRVRGLDIGRPAARAVSTRNRAPRQDAKARFRGDRWPMAMVS